MVVKFGHYFSKEYFKFSIGIDIWKNYCPCHTWCFIVNLGFWWIEIGGEVGELVKEQKQKKESKKAPKLPLMEKRKARQEKKEAKNRTGILQ